jgi:hypothetical protein
VRLLLAVAVLIVAACGGGEPSPESVVRAWSQAVNSGDDDTAARLFAEGARVVQENRVRRLETYADALAWNAALPCSGRIVALRTSGESVRAIYLLGTREGKECDGRGERTQTLINVRDGKIVLWHQLDPLSTPEEEAA